VRVLLVKLSSMGDVIHNLPVVTDLARAFPGVRIDWVTEAPYAEVVKLHPGVSLALEVHLRWLKKSWWRDAPWRQLERDRQAMVEQDYDAILDTQGLVKSVMVARWVEGQRYGYSRQSARETFASRFYNRTFDVPRDEHAVMRNRKLAAAAFGYALPEKLDYGIAANVERAAWLAASSYMVLLHATSRRDKQWPQAHWVALGQELNRLGQTVVLPWGSEAERQASEIIAARLADAIVPPAMSLAQAAGVLAGAHAVVGVDTGLAHLAVALGRPTIGIYVTTSPALTGLFGSESAVNLGGGSKAVPTIPAVEAVLGALPRPG
jgi:heptosyltransferase-1